MLFRSLAEDEDQVRWLEPGRTAVAAARAPVEVGALLHELLVERQRSAVLTSATLAVNGRVDHFLHRVGMHDAPFHVFPSPFDYAGQALLALPKDLPTPDAPEWLDVVAGVLVAAIDASRGGAFVLCTSHEAVRALGDRVERGLDGRNAVLRQGKGSKERLLAHFRQDRGAVLFGTDSFWEGVSVQIGRAHV